MNNIWPELKNSKPISRKEQRQKYKESQVRPFSKTPDLRQAITALQKQSPALTFMEQFKQAARRGELIQN